LNDLNNLTDEQLVFQLAHFHNALKQGTEKGMLTAQQTLFLTVEVGKHIQSLLNRYNALLSTRKVLSELK
jgi:hypothetical protein